MLQRAKQPKQPFTLFQRPGGTIWSVRFSAGGKQVRKSLETDNYDEAHHRAYQIWSEANYRVKNGFTAVVRPFAEVAEEFIKLVVAESERNDRSEYHPRDWPPVIRRYLVGFFGSKPIDTIREPDIERYVEWRRNYWVSGPGKDIEFIRYERNGKILRRTARHEVPSISRQRGELTIVRALFQQALKWGYCGKLEIADIKVRKRIDNSRPSFTPEEFETLIGTSLQRIYPDHSGQGKLIRGRDGRVWRQFRQNMHVISDRLKLHAHIEIASGSGMRPTELKNLDWGHVVGFRSARQGKLQDQDVRFQVQGKGKHGAVVPQLSVIPWLHALWDAFEREVGREPRDDDPVFADHTGKRIESFKKGFSELLKVCDLQQDFRGVARTTYSLRHYYISEMIARGVDVYDIARNTRTSIAMIDKHYGQVSTERRKDQLRPDHKEW
ncbi:MULTISPECIES: tyrosine-type recombinase/integrase [Agrobacterium]|uniref:tyrosine-type recombinase/integrase n=1 Tax=Agrobacterium TaxID=357 RepID=UPI000D1B01AE|nr:MULTISPECIES: tyrosine-type recombinase/integrase [Agrobacterium]MCZ7850681.1 tyrosine-type recombinase/integrase [Agrobacterium salinitolerans]